MWTPPPAQPSLGASEDGMWHIRLFQATPDEEVAAEKAFYAELKRAWMERDEVRAFDLLTEEIALRPFHLELRILRAAVALSGVNAGTLPLKVLGGDPRSPGAASPTRACHALFPDWGVDYGYVPETGHFLQLEAPRACGEQVLAFLRELGL